MAYLGGGALSQDANATTIATSFAPSVTAGSLLVAAISFDWGTSNNRTVTGVADDNGNTWTVIPGTLTGDTTNHQALQLAYCLNANAGATTVTATFSVTTDFRRIVLAEYSGVATSAALDQVAVNASTNTTAANNVTSGTTATLAQADELVVGAVMDTANGTNTQTAGTNYTKRSTAGLCAIEDRTVAATTGVAATWTFGTAGRYAALVATFKNASAGSSNAGTLSASAPRVTASIAGSATNSGTLSASVPRVTGSVAGGATNSGTLTASLPKLTASIAADAPGNSGTLNATLPAVTASISECISGRLLALLPLTTASLDGTSVNAGTLAATLPRVRGTIWDGDQVIYYSFTPPTVEQPLDANHPLLSRYSLQVGQSVVKKDGVYRLTPFPWIGELEGLAEGTDYFMGGRTYVISAGVAAALQADGFTIEDQSTGFGDGPYGSEGYGS